MHLVSILCCKKHTELKKTILTHENISYVYDKIEKMLAKGMGKIPEQIKNNKQQLEKVVSEIQNYLNFIKTGNFSNAVYTALNDAEKKELQVKEEIKSLEFQKRNSFKAPPKEWIDYRLEKLHDTLNKRTTIAALALKEILGVISLEPIKECEVIGESTISPKEYYIAHSKVQTLALLDEKCKGSNWYQLRTE